MFVRKTGVLPPPWVSSLHDWYEGGFIWVSTGDDPKSGSGIPREGLGGFEESRGGRQVFV